MEFHGTAWFFKTFLNTEGFCISHVPSMESPQREVPLYPLLPSHPRGAEAVVFTSQLVPHRNSEPPYIAFNSSTSHQSLPPVAFSTQTGLLGCGRTPSSTEREVYFAAQQHHFVALQASDDVSQEDELLGRAHGYWKKLMSQITGYLIAE